MKKILSILLCLAALLTLCLSFTGCGKDADTPNNDDNGKPDETTQTLVEKYNVKLVNAGKLTIGCEATYPPFETQAEDGSYQGYDIDLAKAIAEKLGLTLEVMNTSFDGILDGIGVNYDCAISAITILPEREETVLFSHEYIENYQAVVVKKGSDKKVSAFTDLNGSTVSLQKSTTSDELMSELNDNGTIDITIVANDSVTTCFNSLKNGEVDFVVCDSTVADIYVATNPDDYEIIYQDESEPEYFAVAIGKEDTALQSAINEAFDQLKAENFFDETYDYWFNRAQEE